MNASKVIENLSHKRFQKLEDSDKIFDDNVQVDDFIIFVVFICICFWIIIVTIIFIRLQSRKGGGIDLRLFRKETVSLVILLLK
eukprot:UN01846